MTISHPAVAAINAQRRILAQVMCPAVSLEGEGYTMKPLFSIEEVNRILRVEITHQGIAEALHEQDATDLIELTEHVNMMKPGPFNIAGVDWYVVEKLPDPGWRVINPLERRA